MLLLLGDIQLLRCHKMTRIYPSPPSHSPPLIALVQFWEFPYRERSRIYINPHPPLTRTVNCVIYSFKTTCNYRLNAPKRCSIDLNVFHVPLNTTGINYYDFN